MTFSPVFTLGASASAGLRAFTNPNQNTPWGNAATLAQTLGLPLGTSANIAPALTRGASFTMTVQVPRGGSVYYIAATDDDDWGFVAVGPISTVSKASPSTKLVGYFAPKDSSYRVLTNKNVITSATSATTATVTNFTLDCPSGVMSERANLLQDDFSTGAGELLWPSTVGYAGDFNGEWVTDGQAARVINPTWPDADKNAPPLPIITGFVKFLDVCPAAAAQLSVTATAVTSAYTDPQSDATLVVYYFDAAGSVLSVDTSLPLHGGNNRRTALYDSNIPAKTRRIAIAPMAYLGPTEKQTIYYEQLRVDYAPQAAASTTLLADAFTSYGNSAFGTNQPTGWSDYGGDWYVNPPVKLVTLYNTAWGGGAAAPPYEAGIFKDFSLSGAAAGDKLNATLFAASTFTSPDSFVLLRLKFSTGEVVDSDRLQGSAWGNLDLRGITIPAGATSARVIVVAVLAANESSSLYVQDLRIAAVK